METINKIRIARLNILIEEAGGLTRFAEKIGKHQSQVSQWVNESPDSATGKPRAMSSRSARDIEEICRKPRGWMDQPIEHIHKSSAIYDQEPVISSKRISFEEDTNASAFFHILDVKAACGEGHFNNDYHEIVRSIEMEPNEAQHLIGSMNRNNKIQIVIASKDSMAPTIQPDDLLFVDMSIKDYAGEAIYILLHGGELICKRLSIVGKTLMVSSDNKFYQSWPWDDRMEGTRIIGRVIRALPMTFKKFGSV
ncbi:LexA family transcriptional regulator [Nitrosomonas sp. Nm58]|uniref:LexA family transcriptional regulator n=1 Tax=Nitrosomonas sp. Nm58 TaxID=200126 RepID=UPI000896121E|nr:LexA family transcriptional regulator [Nitrosomonas sp. Nm58]SDY38015.1 Peptidase S24-like [Nitrosomonas sp. Nm58]